MLLSVYRRWINWLYEDEIYMLQRQRMLETLLYLFQKSGIVDCLIELCFWKDAEVDFLGKLKLLLLEVFGHYSLLIHACFDLVEVGRFGRLQELLLILYTFARWLWTGHWIKSLNGLNLLLVNPFHFTNVVLLQVWSDLSRYCSEAIEDFVAFPDGFR